MECPVLRNSGLARSSLFLRLAVTPRGERRHVRFLHLCFGSQILLRRRSVEDQDPILDRRRCVDIHSRLFAVTQDLLHGLPSRDLL